MKHTGELGILLLNMTLDFKISNGCCLRLKVNKFQIALSIYVHSSPPSLPNLWIRFWGGPLSWGEGSFNFSTFYLRAPPIILF